MGGMGAGGYAQMGTAISGDIVGGIGGLISALGYKRPSVPRAEGMELRLRQLAQAQLLGGGQQLLGATALYNQLAPILMGQLPGIHYVPGSVADPAQGGSGSASPSPMANYQHALANFQQQQGMQQQLTALNRQFKGMKPGAARHDIKMQRRSLRQQLKQMPTAPQLERQEYLGGTAGSMNPAMFDVRQGTPETGPSPDTLESLRSLMQSYDTGPDYSSIYQGAGGQRY